MTICPVGDWTEAVSEAVGAGPAVVAALANATHTAEANYSSEDLSDSVMDISSDGKPKRPERPYSYLMGDDDTMSLSMSDDTIVHKMDPPPGLAEAQAQRKARGLSVGDLMTGGGVRPSDQFYEVVSSRSPSGLRNSTSSNFSTASSGPRLPTVRIDGPYGAPSEDVFRSDLAVLVGAGIGVTPFASILKHIWYRQRAGRLGRLKHVEFIWVCRDAKSFAWFSSVLREIEDAQIDRKSILFVQVSFSNQQLSNQLYLYPCSQLPPHQHVYHSKALH